MTWPEMRGDDLATFQSQDAQTRSLILRLLDSPTDADHEELQSHPNGAMLASWLLELPAYQNSPDPGDEDL